MQKKIKKIFFLLAGAALCAGCPEQVGTQCPPRTSTVGQFALYFHGDPDAGGQCAASQSDGGPPLTPLVFEDGGSRSATFCYGATGGSDGGAQIQLVIPGKGTRTSDLLDDGGFHFGGHSDPVAGTACACPVAIDETFDGYLIAAGAPFAVQPDGGVPQVTDVTGTLVDTLSTPPGTTGCLCSLPCPVTYSITGHR